MSTSIVVRRGGIGGGGALAVDGITGIGGSVRDAPGRRGGLLREDGAAVSEGAGSTGASSVSSHDI